MKIYLSHSSSYDYRSELYEPLKRAFGAAHDITLPHEAKTDSDSKEIITSSDLVLAEVSYPSTGQGIELGWADDAGVPIVCIHKSSQQPSSALGHIARETMSYGDEDDMISKMQDLLGLDPDA